MTERDEFDAKVLAAVADGADRMAALIGYLDLRRSQDRLIDKSLQRLRKARKIEYVRGRWKAI